MKYILVILLVLLASCKPSATETPWPVMPAGLEDCKIYKLVNTNGNSITVARCPLSATTVKNSDKTPSTTITVDCAP